MNAVKRLLLVVVIFLLALCAFPGDASGNRLFIGISFSVSPTGVPALHTMRPWVRASIDTPRPNDVNLFRPGEMHHGYIGAALIGVGSLCHSRFLRTVGGVLLIDDAIQHVLRVDTPAHMTSDRLYKYGWYRSLISVSDSALK